MRQNLTDDMKAALEAYANGEKVFLIRGKSNVGGGLHYWLKRKRLPMRGHYKLTPDPHVKAAVIAYAEGKEHKKIIQERFGVTAGRFTFGSIVSAFRGVAFSEKGGMGCCSRALINVIGAKTRYLPIKSDAAESIAAPLVRLLASQTQSDPISQSTFARLRDAELRSTTTRPIVLGNVTRPRWRRASDDQAYAQIQVSHAPSEDGGQPGA